MSPILCLAWVFISLRYSTLNFSPFHAHLFHFSRLLAHFLMCMAEIRWFGYMDGCLKGTCPSKIYDLESKEVHKLFRTHSLRLIPNIRIGKQSFYDFFKIQTQFIIRTKKNSHNKITQHRKSLPKMIFFYSALNFNSQISPRNVNNINKIKLKRNSKVHNIISIGSNNTMYVCDDDWHHHWENSVNNCRKLKTHSENKFPLTVLDRKKQKNNFFILFSSHSIEFYFLGNASFPRSSFCVPICDCNGKNTIFRDKLLFWEKKSE